MVIQLLQEISNTLRQIEKRLGTSTTKEVEDLFRKTVSLLGPVDIEPPAAVENVVQDEMPEHVSISWIINYFDVGRSTFYRQIKDQLLFHVRKVGNRPFYLKADVKALMVKHEKGAWTFSKLSKNAKDPPFGNPSEP